MNKQIQHGKWENESWKRTCKFWMQEIVEMKNRLSTILKNNISPDFLNAIESLQNELLQKETLLQLVRNDISTLLKLFRETNSTDTTQLKQHILLHEKRRKEMISLQKEMAEYQAKFNQTILSYL